MKKRSEIINSQDEHDDDDLAPSDFTCFDYLELSASPLQVVQESERKREDGKWNSI